MRDKKKGKPRRQCSKCPWKVSTNPHEIPNGYDPKKHAALEVTIANGDVFSQLGRAGSRTMACHETYNTKSSEQLPCVGWLMNQLGPGNNIGLRLAVWQGNVDANVELDGEQHERFEDTLP